MYKMYRHADGKKEAGSFSAIRTSNRKQRRFSLCQSSSTLKQQPSEDQIRSTETVHIAETTGYKTPKYFNSASTSELTELIGLEPQKLVVSTGVEGEIGVRNPLFEQRVTNQRASRFSRCVGTYSMAVGLQVVGLLLGMVSWCLQSSCTSSQVWKTRSQMESVTSNQWQFEGLWMSCAATSLGSLQCSKFKTVLGLPAHVQACRALMIMSLLVGLASIIVSVLGLKCTKIGRASEQVKDQIALTGGILFILSGVFTLIAASWYTARVIQEFYDPLHRGVRYELGTGLYLGWAASCLAILGGSMLCCSYKKPRPSPAAQQFSYNFSTTSQGQNIYRAAPVSDGGGSKAYV